MDVAPFLLQKHVYQNRILKLGRSAEASETRQQRRIIGYGFKEPERSNVNFRSDSGTNSTTIVRW